MKNLTKKLRIKLAVMAMVVICGASMNGWLITDSYAGESTIKSDNTAKDKDWGH
jgi:hypothetical protein